MKTRRYRVPLFLEALLWGGAAYLLIRLLPHVGAWLTSVPMQTDNHTDAVAFALGLATGIWAVGRRAGGD